MSDPRKMVTITFQFEASSKDEAAQTLRDALDNLPPEIEFLTATVDGDTVDEDMEIAWNNADPWADEDEDE